LVSGGKWVYGWVTIGPRRELPIPPPAWDEYGFQVDDEVTFVPGSATSGGFAISHRRLLTSAPAPFLLRHLARARVDALRRLPLPAEVDAKPGERLLAVRGSGRALGFVARGPIYEEALRHPELESFGE
jgi:hypothetical protein